MADEELVEEEAAPALIVSRAVLHVLDAADNQILCSEDTLNLEDPFLEGYVMRQVRRIHGGTTASKGYFEEDSPALKLLKDYFEKKRNFLDVSWEILAPLREYASAHSRCIDVLVADYQKDGVPYFSFVLLEGQEALMHTVQVNEAGKSVNSLAACCTMPAVSKRPKSFAAVNLLNMEIRFADEGDWDGTAMLADNILHCTKEKSTKEILQNVQEIASEVAVSHDENPSLLLSKVKQAVKDNVEEEGSFSLEDVAEEVFEKPEMKQQFLKRTVEAELPKETQTTAAAVNRWIRNQKLMTDTGIEIVFPTDYYQKTDLIEFQNNADGTISIVIKNVGKITNRK